MSSNLSASFPASHSTMHTPQKDYEAAFGALQCQYGFGGHFAPPVPQKDSKRRKWYQWGESRSSSTASLIRPATRSDASPHPLSSGLVVPHQETLSESELRLGKLMAQYGYGSASHGHFNHK